MFSLRQIEASTIPLFPAGSLIPGTKCPHTADNLPPHPFYCPCCDRSWADHLLCQIVNAEENKARNSRAANKANEARTESSHP